LIVFRYDIRRSQEELDNLQNCIRQKELQIKPLKKFSFSSRKNKKLNSSIHHDLKVNNLPSVSLSLTNNSSDTILNESNLQSFRIDAFDHQTILRPNPSQSSHYQTDNLSILIQNSSHILLSLKHSFGFCRINNIKSSHLFLGPCSSAIYIDHCEDVTFHLYCHQLRIHHCNDCTFFIRTKSNPIIEDCQRLSFAQCNVIYDTIADDLKVMIASIPLPPPLSMLSNEIA
jgi:hypothetical protein